MATTRNSSMKAVRLVASQILCAFSTYVALMAFLPFLPKLLLGILCSGENECSDVIYLMGALQLGTGIAAVVTAPILGGLSDSYGRKPIFLLIFTTAILPPLLLACFKTTTGVYLWFLVALVAYTFREGGLIPTFLASVADVVDENHRPEANGLTIGSISVGFLVGTVASTAMKTVDHALWTAVILQVLATIYLQIFLKETNPRGPLLPANDSQSESAMKLLPKSEMKRPFFLDFRETTRTVWSSRRLVIIVMVNFLYAYGLAALDTFTVYYLIAVFNYGEKQLAVIYLLGGGGSALAMTFVYPALSHIFGERVVLWIGLLGGAVHYLLYGLAWNPWMPYFAAAMELFQSVTKPALGTMVSRGVDREQQGKMQGFMSAVQNGARILAPLTITPLSAVSLGENPPFGLKGFPFVVCGSGMVLAWLISTGMPSLPRPMHSEEPTEDIQAPVPPVQQTIAPSVN
ncbi:unnamed protein product [Calypogeia fissa]